MNKITPKDISFHKYTDEIHKAVKVIQEEDLLDLGKEPVVELCKLLEKHRMTIDELLQLIRLK